MKKNNDNANNKKQNIGTPENDPSKAMDSKREVEQSNDAKTDQDFPGYPHYPAKEDIMDQRTGSHKVDTGVSQRFARSQESQRNKAPQGQQTSGEASDDLNIRPGTEADVNDDDLAVLNSSNDEIGTPQNVSTEDLDTDLDIPGSELDDDNESIGEEDEENNYYSLGGDRHESQQGK
jgi:hypothetical protein